MATRPIAGDESYSWERRGRDPQARGGFRAPDGCLEPHVRHVGCGVGHGRQCTRWCADLTLLMAATPQSRWRQSRACSRHYGSIVASSFCTSIAHGFSHGAPLHAHRPDIFLAPGIARRFHAKIRWIYLCVSSRLCGHVESSGSPCVAQRSCETRSEWGAPDAATWLASGSLSRGHVQRFPVEETRDRGELARGAQGCRGGGRQRGSAALAVEVSRLDRFCG